VCAGIANGMGGLEIPKRHIARADALDVRTWPQLKNKFRTPL